jgi:RNA polymerase sigma factor (sigma-70 family)
MDDQSIIQMIRTGKNDLALNALYRNFPIIRRLIRSRGGSTKDAEDIFQEALIILLNKARNPEFQLTAKLSTYLYTVSRFLWNDQQKHVLPQMHEPLADRAADYEPADLADLAGLAAEATDGSATRESIHEESRIRLAEEIINNLKDRCRELLLLFYHDQLDLNTIAERMGYSSANTAKNQKYKCLETARNQLRARLIALNI